MLLNFRHGVVFGTRFTRRSGYNIDLTPYVNPLCVTIADGTKDYYHVETIQVDAAWKMNASIKKAYLYIDLDKNKGTRTFGHSLLAPVHGATPPVNPKADQHWFDINQCTMKVYSPGVWNNVVRIFVAEYTNGQRIYEYDSGSTVGLTSSVQQFQSGALIYNAHGNPLKDSDNTFVTTSSIHPTLSTRTVTGITDVPVAKGTVVKFKNGILTRAAYQDVGNELLGILVTDCIDERPAYITLDGIVNCSSWNWQVPPGSRLWLRDDGTLSTVNLYASDYIQTIHNPIAIVLDPHTIMFTQEIQSAAFERHYIAHDHFHTSSTVKMSPPAAGGTIQESITSLNDTKVNKAGDTMGGFLEVVAPTQPLHAASKEYVDRTELRDLNGVLVTTMLPGQELTWNGTVWVNAFPPVPEWTDLNYRRVTITQSHISSGIDIDLSTENMLILDVNDVSDLVANISGNVGTVHVDFVNIPTEETRIFRIEVNTQITKWAIFHFIQDIQWVMGIHPDFEITLEDNTIVMWFLLIPRPSDLPLIVGVWKPHSEYVPVTLLPLEFIETIGLNVPLSTNFMLHEIVEPVVLNESMSLDVPVCANFEFRDIQITQSNIENMTLSVPILSDLMLTSYVLSTLYPYEHYDSMQSSMFAPNGITIINNPLDNMTVSATINDITLAVDTSYDTIVSQPDTDIAFAAVSFNQITVDTVVTYDTIVSQPDTDIAFAAVSFNEITLTTRFIYYTNWVNAHGETSTENITVGAVINSITLT